MRTLERIRLQHYEGISESEQKGMKGGEDMGLVWSDEFGCYMLPEVVVYGDKPNTYTNMQLCPTCQAHVKAMNEAEIDRGRLGPLFYGANTLLHYLGIHELVNP